MEEWRRSSHVKRKGTKLWQLPSCTLKESVSRWCFDSLRHFLRKTHQLVTSMQNDRKSLTTCSSFDAQNQVSFVNHFIVRKGLTLICRRMLDTKILVLVNGILYPLINQMLCSNC